MICSESSKKKLKNGDNIKGIYIYFVVYAFLLKIIYTVNPLDPSKPADLEFNSLGAVFAAAAISFATDMAASFSISVPRYIIVFSFTYKFFRQIISQSFDNDK